MRRAATAVFLVFTIFSFIFYLAPKRSYGQTGTTLSNLALGAAVSATDIFYDVQTAGSGGVKVTAAQIKTFIISNSLLVTVRSSGAATVNVSAATDYFLCLDPTSNAITLNLPSGQLGLTYLIKDCTGQALAHNITVTPSSGNIDGAATFVMSTNYQSISVTYTGAQWSVN